LGGGGGVFAVWRLLLIFRKSVSERLGVPFCGAVSLFGVFGYPQT